MGAVRAGEDSARQQRAEGAAGERDPVGRQQREQAPDGEEPVRAVVVETGDASVAGARGDDVRDHEGGEGERGVDVGGGDGRQHVAEGGQRLLLAGRREGEQLGLAHRLERGQV